MSEPAIIFIPGWGADGRTWGRLAGLTPAVRISSLSWATCLRQGPQAALAAQITEPCILGGWSLGAMLALQIAVAAPRSVRGLVLMSGAARLVADEGYAGIDPLALGAMGRRLRTRAPQVLRDFAHQCLVPETDAQFEEHYRQRALGHSVAELTVGLKFLAGLDLRHHLATLRCPTLLYHGSHDAIVPPACAEYLASRLPEARLRILQGRSHAIPWTAADAMAAEIEAFAHERSAD